ncbi:unnamed protein product [Rhizophagus irregularis]|nr:unnamed protein product [Rhizophagus irregularis]
MIATNAFGMDLNDKKVRLVIHYSFPLSIGNLVQETGRAGRDHNPAKCIIFYTRHDICTNYTIITQSRESITEDMNDSFEANKRKEYLAKACEKIFEVVHFCEEQYICREQMLAEYFAWNGDNLSPPCAHCDNCLRVQAELVHEVDVKTDAIKMVEVVEEIINKLRESGKLISPKDIIQVYCQLKCDNEELTSLNIYRKIRKKIVRTKADAQHLLDWLIIRGMVKIMINLYRPNPNGNTLQTNIHIVGVIEGVTAIVMEKNWKMWLCHSRR